MDIKQLFFDRSARLRSGWRFAIFCVAFFAIAALVGGSGMTLLYSVTIAPGPETSMIVSGFLMLIPALLAGWLCGKYLERLPFRALGAWFTAGWLPNLLVGILAGATTLAFAVLIAFIFGGLTFESAPQFDGATLARSLVVSLAIFAVGAAWEEALFRGYILQTFHRSGLAWLGIALTSVFFGIIHTRNPDAGVISTLNTILAGIWFSVAYLKTRDLWFVWGMHLMWNWMQGAFFGIEVSGMTNPVSAPLLREVDRGPAWLTGEAYGIEGGIVTTLALIVSTTVIWFMPWLKSEPPASAGGQSRNES